MLNEPQLRIWAISSGLKAFFKFPMGIHMQNIGFSAAILTHLKEAIFSDVAHLILGDTKDVK